MLIKVPVVHFVGPADGANVGIVGPGKPFETLMDDNIMHQEISKAIGHDAKTNGL
ncbi:hypothetical protein [Paraflavitalea speifideaquila]|uniref:hypothetical protein n=1 Tax=Paraflavitalea speifideaquila TaxID=3076558 RepID=UPI0028E84A0A|nr:hypothetical protein [Paraflavitalea speifideiaquila]